MLRSYNFHNSAVVCEESQVMTFDSIFTIATRLGMYSKLFVIGDSVYQNDLGKLSGFKKFIEIFGDEDSRENGFRYFKLDSSQIVRSPFVQFVVKKVEQYQERTKESIIS
jgi:phosphate starvation-inducible protein PhoH